MLAPSSFGLASQLGPGLGLESGSRVRLIFRIRVAVRFRITVRVKVKVRIKVRLMNWFRIRVLGLGLSTSLIVQHSGTGWLR